MVVGGDGLGRMRTASGTLTADDFMQARHECVDDFTHHVWDPGAWRRALLTSGGRACAPCILPAYPIYCGMVITGFFGKPSGWAEPSWAGQPPLSATALPFGNDVQG